LGIPQEQTGRHTPAGRQAVIESLFHAEVIIFDHPNPTLEDLANFGYFLSFRTHHKDYNDKTPSPLILRFNGEKMSPLNPDDIINAQEHWFAHERFHYNYSLNSWILLSRAFKDIFLNHKSKPNNTLDLSYFAFSGAWHPITMQMLFHIAEFTKLLSPDAVKTRVLFKQDTHDIDFVNCSEKIGIVEINGPLYRYKWLGSGKYEPYYGPWLSIQKSMSLQDIMMGKKRLGATSHEGFEDSALNFLSFTNVIVMSEAGWILTKMGEEFVSLIGDSLKDPDIILRWRTQDGRIGSNADIQAMDRWLNTVFRPIKRKVSGLFAQKVDAPSPTQSAKVGEAFPVQNLSIENIFQAWGHQFIFSLPDLIHPQFPAEKVMNILRNRTGDNLNVNIHYGPKFVHLWTGIPIKFGSRTEEELKELEKKAWSEAQKMPKELMPWRLTSKFDIFMIID
jgi:hypothetical protein